MDPPTGDNAINATAQAILDADGYDTGILFSGSGVKKNTKFEGFTIENATSSGIVCTAGASPVIRNNILTHVGSGNSPVLSIDSFCAPRIFNNTIADNTDGTGIECASKYARITNNILTGNSIGIDCLDASQPPFIDFNNVWCNPGGNYVGCSPGINDIHVNPRYVDPDNGDYHLTPFSLCIDSGNPLGILTEDYNGGTVIHTAIVSSIFPGDKISITDGVNIEMGFVNSSSSHEIILAYPFMQAYTVSNQSYVFAETSDFSNEPKPNGMRINLGAYGNTAEAATVPDYCEGDFDLDDDVDGYDWQFMPPATWLTQL
jgi:hypothetical protein